MERGEERGERNPKSLLQRRIEYVEAGPLAEILVELRARGYTWADIAERLGICRKTLWSWRHGGKTKGVDTKRVDAGGG